MLIRPFNEYAKGLATLIALRIRKFMRENKRLIHGFLCAINAIGSAGNTPNDYKKILNIERGLT